MDENTKLEHRDKAQDLYSNIAKKGRSYDNRGQRFWLIVVFITAVIFYLGYFLFIIVLPFL